jgi:hypothetical protein
MNTVFLLWHTRSDSCEEADAKLIGVYESRDGAERAKDRVLGLPGFAEHPKDFEICAYEVGVDHWTEGFVTEREKA